MMPEFEWDEAKAGANVLKHQVTFDEASTVFADPLARIFEDTAHSQQEDREIIIGHSSDTQLLLVSFVDRNEVIRIISARRVTPRERRDYEQRQIR